jgi:flagellar protein FlbD
MIGAPHLAAGPATIAANPLKELKSMIKVTKLNGTQLVVNADLIEFIESTPDTLISLTTGRKIMVLEELDDVIRSAMGYRAQTRIYPVPTGGSGSVFEGETGSNR